jgi:hypothetical protein
MGTYHAFLAASTECSTGSNDHFVGVGVGVPSLGEGGSSKKSLKKIWKKVWKKFENKFEKNVVIIYWA